VFRKLNALALFSVPLLLRALLLRLNYVYSASHAIGERLTPGGRVTSPEQHGFGPKTTMMDNDDRGLYWTHGCRSPLLFRRWKDLWANPNNTGAD
jgi:hypothetical protein